MYNGAARWDEIGAVVQALEIPVVGNGDIKTAGDAVRMRAETGCAGVMIARGSFGNPWIFTQARALLDGGPVAPAPDAIERFAVALRHARMQLEIQGDDRRTALEFRKHLGWYTRGLHGAAELRRELHTIESMAEIERIFEAYLSGQTVAA
jgi:tRNA-dihydrouridine synthase